MKDKWKPLCPNCNQPMKQVGAMIYVKTWSGGRLRKRKYVCEICDIRETRFGGPQEEYRENFLTKKAIDKLYKQQKQNDE